MTIHPTAIVADTASIPESCSVGPYCTIGPDVDLGEDCELVSHVVLDGKTRLGARNRVYSFACLGVAPQDLKYRGEATALEVGDDNIIRECVTISRGTRGGGGTTRLGSHCLIMAYTHIGHDSTIGNHCILANGATLAGHVTVEDHAVISISAIHQFCRIGKLAMIGGCSKVVQDVPPFMIADGNPAETRTINKVGMERQGITDDAQNALKQAYKILFREGLSIPNALAKIEKELPPLPEVQHLVQFVRASERGISK